MSAASLIIGNPAENGTHRDAAEPNFERVE
jgi:hypothetical protein